MRPPETTNTRITTNDHKANEHKERELHGS